MSEELERIQSTLAAFGQQHLVQFWNGLEQDAQVKLSEQIRAIDFELMAQLTSENEVDQVWAELAAKAGPPPAIRLDQNEPISRQDAINAGEQAIADGKVAMILVAGGQGTRLGFNEPKGMYPLGPISKRTLFQILIEKVLAIGNYHGTPIPLFVMTSPATHEASVEFIETRRRFGYQPELFQIFCQGSMPAVDADSGKILLEQKGKIFTAPNGHGGTLKALEDHGCLEKMKEHGVEHIFYCQIDNPMVQVCDPLTIGFHLLSRSQLTTQAAPKREALQKVGNIVEIDGRVQIIEYSDLPDQYAQRQNDDGSLRLWAGNIAVHVFDRSFLEQMTGHTEALPFHRANKVVPYVQPDGKIVVPEQPNAIKFERFIFDLLPMAERSLVVEVDPANAFSPVKNSAGSKSETAATAQQAMMAQARRWLAQCDVKVRDTIDVEISPLFAIHADELAKKIQPGIEITEPHFFQ